MFNKVIDTIGVILILYIITCSYISNSLLSILKFSINKGDGSIYRYYINKFLAFGDDADMLLNAIILLVMLALPVIHTIGLKIAIAFYLFTFCLMIAKSIEKRINKKRDNKKKKQFKGSI